MRVMVADPLRPCASVIEIGQSLGAGRGVDGNDCGEGECIVAGGDVTIGAVVKEWLSG